MFSSDTVDKKSAVFYNNIIIAKLYFNMVLECDTVTLWPRNRTHLWKLGILIAPTSAYQPSLLFLKVSTRPPIRSLASIMVTLLSTGTYSHHEKCSTRKACSNLRIQGIHILFPAVTTVSYTNVIVWLFLYLKGEVSEDWIKIPSWPFNVTAVD